MGIRTCDPLESPGWGHVVPRIAESGSHKPHCVFAVFSACSRALPNIFTLVRVNQVKSDPEKYRQFYQKYSQSIKEGVLEDAHHDSVYKDMLLPLLRYV